MPITVEIKDKHADRFRVYGEAKLTRKPSLHDQINRMNAGKPVLAPGSQIRYSGEQVVAEGVVDDETVSIGALSDVKITKVVFYLGPVESEAVVGSCAITDQGDIEIEFVEPPKADIEEPAAPEIVDE